MTQPLKAKNRERGYFASKEGLEKLKQKKFEKNYSYETIAEKAALSVDTVKRLFYPKRGDAVQIDTIEGIARVLDLTPTDIDPQEQWNPSPDEIQPKETNPTVSREEQEAFLKENPDLAAPSNITNIAQKPGDNANVVGQINDAGAIDFSRKS